MTPDRYWNIAAWLPLVLLLAALLLGGVALMAALFTVRGP